MGAASIGTLEHFSVKWPRFTVENAAEGEEHFSVKWPRFTVENAASSKSSADSVTTETAPACPPTLGAVLAGGLARRLGGGDKALRALGRRPLLDHVIDRLAPQCATLVINANGDPTRFAAWNCVVVPDDIPGHPGPLGGILAVLEWAHVHRPDIGWVATVPGDTPFVPRDLVQGLHAGRERSGEPAACAASGGRVHPAVGLWPVHLRQGLRDLLLAGGSRSVHAWAQAQGCARVEWSAEPRDPFFNVNDAVDLIEAKRLLRLIGTEAMADDRP
jgi:molybdopterin-guanine dinucleotide biosynthesis protein A